MESSIVKQFEVGRLELPKVVNHALQYFKASMGSAAVPVEDAEEDLSRDKRGEAGEVNAAAVTYRTLRPTPRLDLRRGAGESRPLLRAALLKRSVTQVK